MGWFGWMDGWVGSLCWAIVWAPLCGANNSCFYTWRPRGPPSPTFSWRSFASLDFVIWALWPIHQQQTSPPLAFGTDPELPILVDILVDIWWWYLMIRKHIIHILVQAPQNLLLQRTPFCSNKTSACLTDLRLVYLVQITLNFSKTSSDDFPKVDNFDYIFMMLSEPVTPENRTSTDDEQLYPYLTPPK